MDDPELLTFHPPKRANSFEKPEFIAGIITLEIYGGGKLKYEREKKSHNLLKLTGLTHLT